MLVALRLEPAGQAPTLQDLAAALNCPQRPLFLGRKACLPATRIAQGLVQAEDAVAAVRAAPGLADGVAPLRAAVFFNHGAAAVQGRGPLRMHDASDERRFSLDVHAGRQRVYELVGMGAA